MSKRELLFSITKTDLVRETFRCGGNGGQNVNKVETGVRFKHPPSGAVSESRVHRTQHQNEVEAFKKLFKTPEFQAWHRTECARRMGTLADIEQQVDQQMERRNLRVEVQKNGRWVEETQGEV